MRRRGEFLSIQNGGKRLASRHFLFVHRQSRGSVARLGVTVTKKIGGAVKRNRVKRVTRETFRRARQGLPPVDIVVIARKGAAELGTLDITAELETAFGRLVGGARP